MIFMDYKNKHYCISRQKDDDFKALKRKDFKVKDPFSIKVI